jgi:hypothetical protein
VPDGGDPALRRQAAELFDALNQAGWRRPPAGHPLQLAGGLRDPVLEVSPVPCPRKPPVKTTLTSLALALLWGVAPAAHAGFILQPAAASTNMGTFRGSPDNTRNQSGLSAGYTSLVTDFDAYIASNPTHNTVSEAGASNSWLSPSATGNFDFALGGTFTIQSFAFWNLGGRSRLNVRGFDLLADDNAAFSSPTLLGSFTATNNAAPSNVVPANVFTFTPTSAAFVRMRITSNYGSNTSGFGEAAFEVQPPIAVPAPASLTLLGLGALCMAGYGWRRRRTAA